jgi:8-oxo-dGTP diphosphatase
VFILSVYVIFFSSGGDTQLRGQLDSTGGSCLCSPDSYCLCTPSLAIDVIIEVKGGSSVVLVKRQDNSKYATIGGFVEIGEPVEKTVARELKEETGLTLMPNSLSMFGIFSDPRRDHRRHTVSAVYIARVTSLEGLRAGDDAKQALVVPREKLLSLDFAFDHRVIIADYLSKKNPEMHIEQHYPNGAVDWVRSTCP